VSAQSRRPLLAVVYDYGSATGPAIRAAAVPICDLLFVGDRSRVHVADAWPGLASYGELCDVTGLDGEARVRAVARHRPDGIVTFSEYQLAETTRLAKALDLPGHAQETVVFLTDKIAQRQAFANAGVDVIRFESLSPDPRAALAAVGLPAVVKPCRGAGSMHTFRVSTADEVESVIRMLPPDRGFIAEELLAGDPDVAGAFFGDYVSVESLHTETSSIQLCVTGKFRLADPFRETGMFVPCSVGVADQAAVLAVDAAATKALGLRNGVTHTEIKLTPEGPRIIEVNGRLGGYIPEILKRASGISLIQLAIASALGLPLPEDPHPRFSGVTYQYFLAAPAREGTLIAVTGAEDLESLPGIEGVDIRAVIGQTYTWRDGTEGHLGIVYGRASDHAALQRQVTSIDRAFQPVFAPLL
jgi:biotin carboxylase